MKLNEIFGNSHKIGSQKKFYHKREFTFFKDGESVGFYTSNFIISDEDLKKDLLELVELTGADKVVLSWTAQNGFVEEEITLD